MDNDLHVFKVLGYTEESRPEKPGKGTSILIS